MDSLGETRNLKRPGSRQGEILSPRKSLILEPRDLTHGQHRTVPAERDDPTPVLVPERSVGPRPPCVDLSSVGGDIRAPVAFFPGHEGVENVFRDTGKRLDALAIQSEDMICALKFLAQQFVASVLNAARCGVRKVLEEVASLTRSEECRGRFTVAGERSELFRVTLHHAV